MVKLPLDERNLFPSETNENYFLINIGVDINCHCWNINKRKYDMQTIHTQWIIVTIEWKVKIYILCLVTKLQEK